MLSPGVGSGDLARHWAVCDRRRELPEGREEVLLRCYWLRRCRALTLHHSAFNKQLLGVSTPGAAHWGSRQGGQTQPLPQENPHHSTSSPPITTQARGGPPPAPSPSFSPSAEGRAGEEKGGEERAKSLLHSHPAPPTRGSGHGEPPKDKSDTLKR